jgi:ComF family protein
MAERVRLVRSLDIAMPVPLHRDRLRQRGFNQAVVLGHVVAEHFGMPFMIDNLIRCRPTRPQVELSGDERARNVRDAFLVLRPSEIVEKRILLIDDVLTTGATLNECARVLKDAGARSVTAIALARTAD